MFHPHRWDIYPILAANSVDNDRLIPVHVIDEFVDARWPGVLFLFDEGVLLVDWLADRARELGCGQLEHIRRKARVQVAVWLRKSAKTKDFMIEVSAVC